MGRVSVLQSGGRGSSANQQVVITIATCQGKLELRAEKTLQKTDLAGWPCFRCTHPLVSVFLQASENSHLNSSSCVETKS